MSVELASLKNDDKAAWDSVYPTLWGIALAAAARAHPCLRREDHEDVAQGAIAELYQRISKINSESHLKASVAKLARYKAIDLARQQLSKKQGGWITRSLQSLLQSIGDTFAKDPSPSPDVLVSMSESVGMLHEALEMVQQPHKGLLIDFHVNALSYDELSARYNLSINSVGVYLKRGLEMLREAIKKMGKRL